jgi:capsular exopolysaccharide synthesis family protein
VGSLKGDTLAERDRSVQYNILRREVDTNRALYEALLQRFKEVSAEAGVTTNNISIIDRALPPRDPSSPRPLLNMALALLLGLIGAGAWVIGREQLTDAVRTPDDVALRAGLALLGVTPRVREGSSPLDAIKDPKTPFSEAVHAIRASLELTSAQGVPASLAFTSARPAEGKSTLAFALAREFALAGKRVALLDGDMRAPTVHRLSGLSNKNGLSQLLARQAQLGSVLQKSTVPGLDVITSGPIPPDPTLLLDGHRLQEIIQALHSQYDLVLIDSPPVLGLADALQIASSVAASIIVIEANDTRLTNLKTALTRLRASHITPTGAILSKFDAAKFGYGENYGYYYAKYGEK